MITHIRLVGFVGDGIHENEDGLGEKWHGEAGKLLH